MQPIHTRTYPRGQAERTITNFLSWASVAPGRAAAAAVTAACGWAEASSAALRAAAFSRRSRRFFPDPTGI
eukprot:COSAG01_NODE_3633_length_5845_cov_5.382701_5_plen_71_part_00